MLHMKTSHILWALGLIVIIVIATFALTRDSGQEKRLRVGAILPLSGELAYMGEQIEHGIELGKADFPNVPADFTIEDDKSLDNKTAVNVLGKLLSASKSDLVFNMTVTTTKALAPITAAQKTPLVIMWDSNDVIKQLPDWVSSMGFSNEAAGEDMATFAYTKLGYRKIGIVSAQEEWSTIISNAFEKKFTELGGTIVLHDRTPLDQKDYRTNVLKAKAAGAETIYLPLFTQGITITVRQARELGFTGPLLSGDVFSYDNITALGKDAENIYITQMWLEDATFAAKYKAKFGTTDPTNLAFAALGYDAVHLVAELTKNGIPSHDTMHKQLHTIALQGVTGTTKFEENGLSHKREKVLHVEHSDFVHIRH